MAIGMAGQVCGLLHPVPLLLCVSVLRLYRVMHPEPVRVLVWSLRAHQVWCVPLQLWTTFPHVREYVWEDPLQAALPLPRPLWHPPQPPAHPGSLLRIISVDTGAPLPHVPCPKS